jgi:hypothetical protein
MTLKRLSLVLPALAGLAACGGNAPADDGRAASGEVLEGTISDSMLPVDRVRSEPPLEDPAAFARARSAAVEGGNAAAEGEDASEGEQRDADEAEAPVPDVTPLATDD